MIALKKICPAPIVEIAGFRGETLSHVDTENLSLSLIRFLERYELRRLRPNTKAAEHINEV